MTMVQKDFLSQKAVVILLKTAIIEMEPVDSSKERISYVNR
jgi:hypothetical protein